MFSFYNIRIISNFEIKTLLRGWFFRIFAGLAVLGIGTFNIAAFVEASGAPWIYRALPAAIPYANLIILNLGQAIVAVFLASEFLKQDKKNDTIEVIYARSMTNAEYIIGKTLGILIVFFILNLIILSLGIGFSFLSSDSSRNILAYFYYPFLISLPTLVYILGLSFFLMTLIKNQAVTFILLLGYIALTVFWLNDKFFHLADFVAYHVPMIHSTIGGFGNINEILLHRGIYLVIGLAFIFFTIHKINRLPQAGKFKFLPLVLTVLFLLFGAFLTNRYIKLKKDNISYKKELIALNNLLNDKPKMYTDSCKIELEHTGKKISVTADLVLTNRTQNIIDTIIVSLNPDLEVISVMFKNSQLKFERDLHILKVKSNKTIKPGDKYSLTINYTGTINENTNFIDINPDEYDDNFSIEIFRVRKRYAYLQDQFVCLTRESLWYPIIGTSYSTNKPAINIPDFTNYSLKVKTNKKLTAVSQGNMQKISDGIFVFEPEFALPKISLLIGNYQELSIIIDSTEFKIYTKKGNNYFADHFNELKDSLPALINDLKNEYETFIGFKYPFKRFILAEVPIHFALDKHIWSSSSDAVQPEIVFYPEKGVLMEETDFKKREKREEERMKEENEEILPEELQARIFKRFVRGNFMATPKEWYQFRDVVDRNTYTIFPNFYTYLTQIRSDSLPIINLAMEFYLRERNVVNDANRYWRFEGLSVSEKINLELKEMSLNALIKKGIDKKDEDEDPVSLNDLVIAKGNFLFSLFKTKYGDENFDTFIYNVISKHKHESIDYKYFDSLFTYNFKDTITYDIDRWLNKSDMPGFIIKDVENYKVIHDEYSKYQVKFKISNSENVDGYITISFKMADDENRNNREWDDLDNIGFSKKVFISAKSAKEIGFIFNAEPAAMNINTQISKNLPNNINFDFKVFDEYKKIKPVEGVYDYKMFERNSETNEIIVDNEDEGFEYSKPENQSYLKSLINKSKEEKYEYSGIRFWSPPGDWQKVLRSGFYGKYIRSAMYTKAGSGNRTATWNALIEKAGYYDIYANIERIEYSWGRKDKLNYNYKIPHDEGTEEISLDDQEIENGWNYLGTFYISGPDAKVILTDKSYGNMVFADAIKWVKSK